MIYQIPEAGFQSIIYSQHLLTIKGRFKSVIIWEKSQHVVPFRNANKHATWASVQTILVDNGRNAVTDMFSLDRSIFRHPFTIWQYKRLFRICLTGNFSKSNSHLPNPTISQIVICNKGNINYHAMVNPITRRKHISILHDSTPKSNRHTHTHRRTRIYARTRIHTQTNTCGLKVTGLAMTAYS